MGIFGVIVFGILINTGIVLSTALAVFLFRRRLWVRFVACVAIATVVVGHFVELAPVLGNALFALAGTGILLAAALSLVFVPLIAFAFVGQAFRDAVHQIDDLHHFALDTEEWSAEWKMHMAAQGFEALLAQADFIQQQWIREQQLGPSLLPLFATVVLGQRYTQIAEYFRRHRNARYELLELARLALDDGTGNRRHFRLASKQ